jgi:hypothetical protein
MSQKYARTADGMGLMVEEAGFGRANLMSQEENHGRIDTFS